MADLKASRIVATSMFMALFLPDAVSACDPRVRVVGVKRNDVLMIRAGPSQEERVIGIIAPEARRIDNTCECVREWCKVRYFDVVGWVSRVHLATDRQ